MGVIRLSAVSVLLFLSIAAPASAQYFGRNKVEYEDFDFRILATQHFDIYYYPREERAARLAAQLAERWYARFAKFLHHEFDRRQPLVLYGSQAEFAQTNVVPGLLPDTVGGVTESTRRRIVLPFAPTLAETNRVLGHEIAHAFQFDIARRNHDTLGQPLWFVEGMAEYLARGATDAEALLWRRDAARSDRLPRRQRDAARHLSPYHYGHAFWAYLAQRFGDDVIEKTLKPGKRRKLNDRMRGATGFDLDALFDDWRASIVSSRNLQPQSHMSVTSAGKEHRDASLRQLSWLRAGRMQLGPALSPDGRQAVFFSERDRLSLDLYLVDVESGEVTRKLATTTASARFDSLQAVRSAGAWSPTGEWFAFPAVRQGRAALVLLDMRHGTPDREILFRDLGQVLSPTWSPDGSSIAFSALTGGFTNLYLYEVKTQKLTQLTDDAFADLHPAWSPDGQTIAFATERYASDLSTMRFGRPQLATIDVQSHIVRPLLVDGDVAHTNPQWSPDGRQLYFIADADGIGNVFRLDLDSSATYRITHVETGVTGVTPNSPALSLASDASVLAFTVYRDWRHQLAILRGSAAMAGERVDMVATVGERETVTAGNSPLAELLEDSSAGLPDPASIANRKYHSRLSLERIGEPFLSSGSGAFGTFFRGGGSLLFGDMLGERRMGTAVEISKPLRFSAIETRFLNQQHRWNWGAVVGLEPALRGYRRYQINEDEGEPTLAKQIDYLQRVQLQAAGLVAYPFNRGLRIELTGGIRHATYQREVYSQLWSLSSGRLLRRDHVVDTGGLPTTVAEIGTALVGDTTVFGPTGPLVGARYRFEVTPAVGSITYTRVLADYRRYFMPVRPYSVALRVLHVGRYGPDGDDPRLLPTFLGSRYFIRGHELNSRYCQTDSDRACGDELRGSRLLVGNLELRFPLWGLLTRQLEYGPLPADGFIFADGGMVSSLEPNSSARRRNGISSIGAGIRINPGGLPVEIAAVRALDGPAPRWLFDLGLRVGF